MIYMAKKGENIYKRKDKRWEARYMKGHGPDGTPRFGYCYGRTYREAKEKLQEAKTAMLTHAVLPCTRHKRFAPYCNEWLQLNRSRVKESTLVKYITAVEKHILPKLGGCTVDMISSVLVEQFSHELLYEEKLAPKTVKDILIILRSILDYAAKQHPGACLPIEIIYPKDTKKEIRILTKEEQSRFVRYLFEDMDACKFGVMLALLTGMRLGELCALQWDNISLNDSTIKVCSAMQRIKDLDSNGTGKTKIVISNPKSDCSYRIIPLSKEAAELCRRWQAHSSGAFILTSEVDRFIEPRTVQYRFERYIKECGLEGVNFHALRHTFATRAVEAGFEIKSLSEVLGHANPRITLERYVHSSLDLKRNNMNKLSLTGFLF